MTDGKLLQTFHFSLFSNLRNFCGDLKCLNCQKGKIEKCPNSPTGSSLWEDMKYELKVIQLYTTKQKDKTHKISDISKET